MTKILRPILICFVLLFTGFQASAAEPLSGRVNQSTWVAHLENGVVVILRHVPDAPTVSIRTFIRGGSISEGEYAGSGIAYLLERVVLGGSTENRQASESMMLLKRMGASTESYTTKNTTVFHLTAPTRYLGEGLTLMADWLFQSRLLAEEVAKAKSEIARQQEENAQDPQVRLHDVFFKTLFQTHPVRNPVMGYMDPLVALDDISLIGHYRRTYVTDRTVLVMAGDFSSGVTETLSIAQATFGVVERRAAALWLPPPENRQGSARYLAIPSTDKNSRILLGWHSTGSQETDNDFYALEVLSALLGIGQESLLGSLSEGADALALRAQAFHISPVEGLSAFMVQAETKGDGADALMAKFYQGLKTLRESGPEADALAKSKKQLIARLILPQNDASSISERIGEDYIRNGDPEFQDVYRREIERVTANDIKRVLNRYISTNRQTLVLQKPEPKGEIMGVKKPETQAEGAKLLTLRNGLRVVLNRQTDTQAVSIHAFLKGGVVAETDENSGVFRFYSHHLNQGSENQTAQEQQAALAAMGAELESSSGQNSVGVGLTVVKDDLAAALGLVFETMSKPNPDSTAIAQSLRLLSDEQQNYEGNWRTLAIQSLKENFWKGHPFGRSAFGTYDSRKKLTKESLAALVKDYLVGPNMVVAIYGNFDEKEVLSALTDTFGSLPSTSAPIPQQPKGTFPNGKLTRVEGPLGHVLIGMTFAAPGLDSPQAPGIGAVVSLLVGAGSEEGLMQETLIEKKDVADFVDLQYLPAQGEGAFFLVVHSTPEKENDLSKALEDLLLEVRGNEQDLDRVNYLKDLLISMRRQGTDTLQERARSAALEVLLGLALNQEVKYQQALSEIRPATLQELASEYLRDPKIMVVAPE